MNDLNEFSCFYMVLSLVNSPISGVWSLESVILGVSGVMRVLEVRSLESGATPESGVSGLESLWNLESGVTQMYTLSNTLLYTEDFEDFLRT